MSDIDKMYEAPDKLGDIQSPIEGAGGVTVNTKVFIGEAAPWLKFIAVISFIGCGLLALSAVIMLITSLFVGDNLPGMGMYGGGFILLFAALYLGMAVLYFFPARFLMNMGNAGSSYKYQSQPQSLQELASNLKKWAKFNGILIIILIVVVIFVIIGLIVYSFSRNL